MNFIVSDKNDSLKSVINFIDQIRIDQRKNIILLRGDLGAGKTSFVKTYVNHLGGDKDEVDSPTFSLLNTYSVNNQDIHHFDLYRIQSPQEIEDIGFMEYMDSGNLCFVEWPEKIAEFLPHNQIIFVDIVVSLDECRNYTIS
ncbi:MAG: tRNA (adenosine(37)-N6)-threonylcarbamoyltransferase complex ATPase subunit type 1 TsaE [Bacteroidia bacterium]|nr:tRNA (adenosine(37)-N6)-threonylcarbamoyltransferase complex ATPase subunit type 1 TsaE [Bacteroidia bacterium]